MAVSQEFTQTIDTFTGINKNNDEVTLEESQFQLLSNVYIDNSPHELKVRPGFIELGQSSGLLTNSTSIVGPFSYMSRFNTRERDTILLFPWTQSTLSSGAQRINYDQWANSSVGDTTTTDSYSGRITTSAFYVDKEYFFGPGMAKDITWSIDLAGNNSGGGSDVNWSVTLEQSSFKTAFNSDVENTSGLPLGVYSSITDLQTGNITGLITAAGGANIFKNYTGTLTLSDWCYWARLSIRVYNIADPVGNKRLRIKNPSVRDTNYSTRTNRIVSSDFSDFTHNWARRVVTASTNPTNEIVIIAANLATQTSLTLNIISQGIVEIYPDVAAKTSCIVNIGIYVCTLPMSYYNVLPTGGGAGKNIATMNFSTFAAPPFQGVHLFKDRVWGFEEQENRLWYSAIGDPTSYPTVNFVDIGENDENITGLFGLNDRLIIFKDKSVWFLFVTSDTASWNLRKVDSNSGCSSQYTIKEIDGIVYFTGYDGVYSLDGSTVNNLSDAIKNVFFSRTVIYPVYDFDHAGVWKDNYIVKLRPEVFAGPTQPDNTLLYVYNITFNSWFTWSSTGIAGAGLFLEDNLKSLWGPGLLCCQVIEATYATIYLPKPLVSILPFDSFNRTDDQQVYLDSGYSYTAEISTKAFNFSDSTGWKKVKYSDLIAEGSAQVELKTIVDGNTSLVNSVITSQINTDTTTTIPGPTPIKSIKSKINAMCKTIRVYYKVTPRLPLGISSIFTDRISIAGYSWAGFRSTGTDTYDYFRQLAQDGFGIKFNTRVSGSKYAELVSPYIPVLPNVTTTITVVLDQRASQANNSRTIAVTWLKSDYTFISTTSLAANTTFSGVVDTLVYTPTSPALSAFALVTIHNGGSVNGYWYLKSLVVSPSTAGETNTYLKNKISIYNINLYLHKMRTNIKALT